MNEEEKRKLIELEQMISEIHGALFKRGHGGQPPMIERISTVVDFADKGQWAISWSVKLTLGLGAIMAAFVAIKTGVFGK
jgi:hypothetical protein